jgi:hypothetical protein
MANEGEIRKQLAGEIDRLRQVAASSTNPCLVAQYIAFSDEGVQELFVKKNAAEDRFKACTCLPSAPNNQQHVLFEFDYPDGVLRLVKPSFLAVVDIAGREVAKVIDPYIPDQPANFPPAGSLPFALGVPSNAPNVTIPADALKPFRAREAAFGQALGCNQCNPCGPVILTTICTLSTASTLVSVSTFCPFPVQDDSQAMYAQDQAGPVVLSDTHVDDNR